MAVRHSSWKRGRVLTGLSAIIVLLLQITVFPPAATLAAVPGSLSFSGVNYVQVPDNASLRIPVNLTVEAWMRPTAVSGHRHIVGKNNYELSVEPQGTGFRALFEFSTNNGFWQAVSSAELPLNQWYHIAGSYDGSNMRLFVNGTRVASTLTTGNIDQTSNPLRIASADASGDFFIGQIDEVRVSNVIRYTGQFVIPQAPFTPDSKTVGLWHFDEGNGSSVADSSGLTNNGTVIGTPNWTSETPFSGPDTTPPTISAVQASLLSTQATISWLTNEQATSQILYGPTVAYGSSTALDSALVSSHSQTLTGLTPNTTYQYSVVSRDAAGNQTSSANLSFTTLLTDPAVGPVITNMASSNISTAAATITWATDLPADSQVEYGTTTSYGSSTTLDSALVSSHSQILSGLAAGTTYQYRVKSRGTNGIQTVSGNGVLTTSSSSTAVTEGQWESATSWPLVAVHGAMQPSGNILLWDAWELAPNVAARVWNPTSQSFVNVTNQFSSIFCSFHVGLADGRTLVSGGFNADQIGIKDTNIFNPATNSWSKVANMAFARWYPTALTLSDGRVITLGGLVSPGIYADIPEIYDVGSNLWTRLNGAQLNVGEYPNSYLLPNGKIFMVAGPDGKSRTLDVGNQAWAYVADAPVATGSSVMYRPGKILAAGGGTNNADPVVKSAAVIDMTQAAPAWRSVASMANLRFQHNLVVLPDGKVLAIGGASTYSLTALQGARQAELWDPATETWSPAGSQRDLRMYHSTAMLLPDGRVLSAGGGRVAPAVDYLTAEIYSPPYLFKGTRPTISTAPTQLTYGAGFAVDTPNAAEIASVTLVHLPSVTHTVNTDQRYVPLSFTKGSGTLSVAAPVNGNLAPPGYYMLFIVNANGVPSVAKIVQVGGSGQVDSQAPTVSLTAPAAGSTVSGSAVTVAATASDNIGVSSVQFLLDGAPLGAPVSAAPYSVAWNSTTAVNGPHTITARASDAAGNTATSADVTVTVSNTITDATPPTISAVAANNIQTSSATIGWTTDEPATSQVEYGPTTAYGTSTTLDSLLLASHSQALAGLTPNTVYHFRVRSTDAAGNAAVSVDQTLTTPAANAPVTLLGTNTIQPNQDANPGGVAEAFQYIANASGGVNSIAAYIDSGTTASQVVLGLYSNTRDDNPGVLLAQGTITNPTVGGWNSVDVSAAGAAVTSGAKYWIAALSPTGSGLLRFRNVASGGKAQTSATSTLSILPTNWNIGATYFNSPMSAYVVSVGSGGAPDTLAPTVSLTAPAANSTLSGSAVTVSASASDNLAVTSVQFLLDGSPLGAPVTSAPYSISWNTTAATNGAHTLSARASDAAGNTATATTIAVTVSNSAAATLFGETTIKTQQDSNPAGVAEAFQYTATASGSVNELALYLSSNNSATKVIVGVYTNNASNNPGTLLTQAMITAPTKGAWNKIAVPTTLIAAGTKYWIALLSPTGSGTVQFRDVASGGRAQVSSQTNLTTLPTTWSPGATYLNAPMSAYGSQVP